MTVRHALTAWVTLMLLVATGCTSNVQYRTQLTPCDAQTGDVREACAEHFVEEREEYLLGFVEFDDQGWFWDRQQMWKLVDRLAEEGAERDLLMVVFVHGWKHNAQVCDTNVSCLRETLLRLHEVEAASAERAGRPERRIAGIYVGWRGLSVTAPVLDETTFFGRKTTAERVGSRGVTELLLQLEGVRNVLRQRPGSDTRLVYVGHSFGGQMLYSAVSQILMERAIGTHGTSGPPETLGDLVVLLNPAFEASLYHPVWEIATERTYQLGQRPVIAIFTSEGDDATGRAFPLGRFVSTSLQKHRSPEQRRANRIAVGHYEPYFTHRLDAEGPAPSNVPLGDADACQCPFLPPMLDREAEALSFLDRMEIPWRPSPTEPKPPAGWELRFPGSVLRHLAASGYDPLIPFLVVEVDNEIITGHSQIYKPVFVDFLRYFIAVTVEEPLEAAPGS